MKPNKKEKTIRENLKKIQECDLVQVTFADDTKSDCDVICNFSCDNQIVCVLFSRGEKLESGLLKTYAVLFDPATEEVVLDNEMEEDELNMIRQIMNQNLTRDDEAKTPICELVLDEVEEVLFTL